jgi:hypothetical protein
MPARESFPRHCAALLAQPWIRVAAIGFAAIASLILLPLSCMGLLVFLYGMASTSLDSGPVTSSWQAGVAIAGIGALAIAGLVGIVAAWIRLMIKGVDARIGKRTYRLLCAGLAAGVIDGVALTAFMATQSPDALGLRIFLALVTAAGTFLLAATLGIRPQTTTVE